MTIGPTSTCCSSRSRRVRALHSSSVARRQCGICASSDNVLDLQVARGLDGGGSFRARHGRNVLHITIFSVFFASRDFFPPVEHTFLLAKPDAIEHGHADEIARDSRSCSLARPARKRAQPVDACDA